jgi:HEPN domain-containing protein/predicted nucleotidyltransferase
MKETLDHLPDNKQEAIAEVRRIILNEVDAFQENKTGKKARGRISWVILFGSYARGDYVDDPENGYMSDVDVLVLVTHEELANALGMWSAVEDKAERHTRLPINLIVHEQQEVLNWLHHGHYFFSDIQREGIYLHSYTGKPLPEPKLLTNAERLPVAEKHYAQWFESAKSFLIDYSHCFDRGDYKKAAFELHQATERFYACLLLVTSNYRPKTHNLKILHRMAVELTGKDARLTSLLPTNQRFEKRCFELLRRAYIDARYSEHFKITEEELAWLFAQINQLKTAVNQLCEGHLDILKRGENFDG